jgi:hypothetical protein
VLISSSLAGGAGDRLYRSTDGGLTFSDVLDTTSPIVDLAIETGGGVVVATLGTGAPGVGSFQSADHGASFSPMIGAPQLACAGQRGDGAVFGCGANWEPDFKAVARRRAGSTWSKQFRFDELAGPLDCPAGTGEHDLCGGMWPALQKQFAATGPTACAVAPPPGDDTQLPPPPKKTGGGCCETGTPPGALGGLGLVAALCLGLVLRRRRQ